MVDFRRPGYNLFMWLHTNKYNLSIYTNFLGCTYIFTHIITYVRMSLTMNNAITMSMGKAERPSNHLHGSWSIFVITTRARRASSIDPIAQANWNIQTTYPYCYITVCKQFKYANYSIQIQYEFVCTCPD